MSKISSLASEIRASHKPDRLHHHPKVEKGRLGSGQWYVGCVCGYLRMYPSWKRAVISALKHSTEIQP